jgi:anti-sigma factor RsiW
MNANDRNPHPTREALERYLDEDLLGAERAEVEAHVSACAGCRREVESYRVLFADLDRIPSPEPPAGFDVRVLDAVLPKKVSESAALLRLASGAYAALSVLLMAVVGGLLIVGGPKEVESVFAYFVSRVVGGALATVQNLAVGFIDLLKAAGDLLSVAGPAQTLARGLETAATAALGTHVLFVFALGLTLAALILAWALSSARERGVPHVCLTL